MLKNQSSLSTASSTIHKSDEDVIDIKQILNNIAKNWLLFFASIIVCLVITFIYAKYATSSWHVSSKILVKSDNGGGGGLGGTLSGDLGSIFNAKSSADNEIQILKSRSIMQKAVKVMQLNVRTYQVDGFKKRELFEEAPFDVVLDYKVDTLVYRYYKIKVKNAQSFVISNAKDDLKIEASFGKVIKLKQYNLALKIKPGIKFGTEYAIGIDEPDAAVDDFSKNFVAALSDKQATTIDLSLNYQHPGKGEAILNRLMQLYLTSNLDNEKQIADSTYAFINSRIELVSQELNNIEKRFEEYKTQNNLANISEQSKALVASASSYYDKLATQETQLSVINDLEKYLNDPKNKKVIPSSLVNPADQSFGQAINSYNDLLRSRDKSILSYTEDNPVVQNLDVQLNNARVSLLKNIETYKKSLQVGQSELKKENTGLTGKLKQLPAKERNYLDFARQQNLKQELYLYLLQKREETAISRNSTISSSRILDYAKSDFLPFQPKKSVIYIIGFVVGLIIPALYLFIKSLLNTKIQSKSDIEKGSNISILGEIGHNSEKQNLVVGTNSRSVISEQFRNLRTNLQFVLDTSKSNVILFTSSMSGEGKSFIALNLGSALALTGKKVVIIEMDLRKPKLSESLGMSIDNGFTNYAITDNSSYDFDKILKPLSFNKDYFLVSSGPIPPNPAELLLSDKVEILINYLKGRFDYVIIDCAPVGLVTDALIIEKHADLIFYVTRQAYTFKSQLSIANELAYTNKENKIYLLVNDIKAGDAGAGGYKQSYGYGIEHEKTVLDKLKFWKKK